MGYYGILWFFQPFFNKKILLNKLDGL